MDFGLEVAEPLPAAKLAAAGLAAAKWAVAVVQTVGRAWHKHHLRLERQLLRQRIFAWVAVVAVLGIGTVIAEVMVAAVAAV